MGCSAQLMIFFVEIDQNVLRTNFQYLEFLEYFPSFYFETLHRTLSSFIATNFPVGEPVPPVVMGGKGF